MPESGAESKNFALFGRQLRVYKKRIYGQKFNRKEDKALMRKTAWRTFQIGP
jgi:hypothetical protein